jgi:capsid protein
MPGNPGAVAAMLATNTELRAKSRDLVRRNAWAQAGIEAFVSNAVGTGIKPQSLSGDERFKAEVQALWRDWTRKPTPPDRPTSTACRRWPVARCSKAANA